MVHVLAGRFPVEIDRAQHLHRDRFDIGEELGQPLLGALAHRRQRQRAIAEDHGGGAVLGREGAQRVPGDLRVVMAVIVDKAGGDGAARRRRSFARPAPLNLPISTILPFLMPTSPRNAGMPEPSTTSPFLISRSYAIGFFLSAERPRVAARRTRREVYAPWAADTTPQRRHSSGRAMFRARGCQSQMHAGARAGQMVRGAGFVLKPVVRLAAPAPIFDGASRIMTLSSEEYRDHLKSTSVRAGFSFDEVALPDEHDVVVSGLRFRYLDWGRPRAAADPVSAWRRLDRAYLGFVLPRFARRIPLHGARPARPWRQRLGARRRLFARGPARGRRRASPMRWGSTVSCWSACRWARSTRSPMRSSTRRPCRRWC